MSQEKIDALAFWNKDPLNTIYGFFGPFRFLSNFHVVSIPYDGLVYPSTEAAYMSGKTDNPLTKKALANTKSPSEAKRIGRALELREDWDDIRIQVMEEVNTVKYTQDTPESKQLRQMLLVTKPCILVEANWWNDTFWGECKGVGENNLGKVLMRIRDTL